jgi:PKD repeat protein
MRTRAFLFLLILSSASAFAEANLVATGTATTAPTVGVGAPFQYSTTITNNGTAAAGPFFVRFRFSANKFYSTDKDILIGDFDVSGGLAAGASIDINFQNTCPDLPAGVYYVVGRVDVGEEVAESNEDDNYFFHAPPVIVFTTTPGTTPVISSGPIATPVPAFPGQPVAFSVIATGDATDVLSYTWLFGDDIQSLDADPLHAYANAGTYTVRVLVSDGKYGSTAETTVTIGGTPSDAEALDFFQQRFELDADAVSVALAEAGIVVIAGSNPEVDTELEEARALAATLVAETSDPKITTIYAKKVKQVQSAATKLLEGIKKVQLANDTTGTSREKAQSLILNTIKLAAKTNKTLFSSLPKFTPGMGGGMTCPPFIIEEVGGTGFHFAGEIVKFKISTAGNAPWPPDAEIRVIDNAQTFGKSSNKDGGFNLKPPPKSLSVTMGPDAGSSRVEIRCGNKLPKSRLLYNKGPKPVKSSGGGGGGTKGPFDGTYACKQTLCINATHSQAQGVVPDCSSGNITVTVVNGQVSDGGFLSGTVDAAGVFTGTYSDPSFVKADVTGTFSTSAVFTLEKQPVVPNNQAGYNVKWECMKN